MEVLDFNDFRRQSTIDVVVAENGEPALPEEWDYEPEPDYDEFTPEEREEAERNVIGVRPSEFVEFAINVPDKENNENVPFTFEGRRYLREIYDSPAKRILLKCGRQVEKTVVISSICRRWDGTPVAAGDVAVGDYLASMSTDGSHMTHGRVDWVSRRYTKPCVKITTRQGHVTEVATTHPMRTWDAWTEAGQIKVGDRLAVVRRCGIFHQRYAPEKERISDNKFIPYWVWGVSREDTALFLNRLWSTDGHVKQNSRSKYSLEYCSISKLLIRDVQALLWKFGIPSKIRKNWPNYWKKRGIKKLTYILRVETKEGVNRFLNDIACLGKSEDVPSPTESSSSNRDTYPIEVNRLIKRIIDSRGNKGRYGQKAEKDKSLRKAGLRETLKYAPTAEKLQQYVDFFRSDFRYDQNLVEELERHLDTDLYWDKITEIEYLGEQECVDFQVEDTHNFVADGFITHNSTTLGNRSFAYCCIVSSFRVLYVSPANMQTKQFSQDRLKEPLEISPTLKAWTTPQLTDNVFKKSFLNQSSIALRYAYHNADRTRGIAADLIALDEIQDIITNNIPVIEKCASHSPYKLFSYSGTPKSYDNAIEKYWVEHSTQNEWVVPCHNHSISTTAGIVREHWNILGEENIGKNGLICSKCGKSIDSADPASQWAAMNANVRKKLEQPFEGYRIPQLMVPWIDWAEQILDSYETDPRNTFFNEVLGESYDSGTRPLTREDVIQNCWTPGRDSEPEVSLSEEAQKGISKIGDTMVKFAGIDWGCHDEETRILTTRGFVYFKDLTKDDEVAQWDPESRDMTFVYPKVKTVKEWDQPLHHYKAKGLDMMLTHTHRMRVRSPTSENWKTEPAEKTSERSSVFFVGHLNWNGEEVETFTLPGIPKSSGYSGSRDQLFHMDGWLEFLGYYLSEGGLCFNEGRPSCLKMSQRESVNPKQADKMQRCLQINNVPHSEFPNPKTGDLNWTIYGKQYWQWIVDNVGSYGNEKRLPREFLRLSKRQLRILFDAMMLGDGNTDPRVGNNNGYYSSTSKGLCEDFQELCIRLGLRSTLSLHKPASKAKKAIWRTSWSGGRDFQFNSPIERVKKITYSGKVYCCSVPTGYIVTERNGCIAYQGNTGENTYTVITIGGYLNGFFTTFYYHRFEGQETDPDVQVDLISKLIRGWNVSLIGVDYGGGYYPNNRLKKRFGNKVVKYQYSQPGQKVRWEQKLDRFVVHRTEVMSDVFNAIRRKDVFRFPKWEHFEDPFADDFLSIFSEYNESRRQIEYNKAPDKTDDSFHALVLCFLVSLITHPRVDLLNPAASTSFSSDEV